MTANALLRDLETLTHDARMRRMADLGKAARMDGAVRAMLDPLDKKDFYGRLLSLQSCYGSGDAAGALRALSDPSRTIQARALKLVVLFAPNAEVGQALLAARYRRRLMLLSLMRRSGRLDASDAFLNVLAVQEPAALSLLLPYGSRSAVERHLDDARPLAGDIFWRRLSRLHPESAVRAVESDLAKSEPPDARLLREAGEVLTAVAVHHPDLGLRLARALVVHQPLARLLPGLQLLASRRPEGVADLLLASTDAAPVSLDSAAHRLDLPRLQALIERRSGALTQPQRWLRRLPPPTRAALFLALERHWRDAEGRTSPLLIAALPAPLRRHEALRNLRLPALATRPEQRLPYAAFLPWDEAMVVLDPWLKHPEGEWRGLALQTLAGTARYERGRLADLLAFIGARRNEQDPVRLRMLAGLADLPPGAWRAEHLEGLGQILRDALSAADLSVVTAGHAERLVVALLRFHPDWAAGWLATLVRERGRIHVGNLEDRLNETDVRRIAPALLPVLRSWQDRERQGQLASFAQSLGRRIRVFPGLMEVLEEEIRVTRTQWSAEYTLGLLARYCKERLAVLVPRLLKDDPSWATRAVVYQHLHRRRQDLLTPFLGRQAFSGRFSTGRTRFVLPLVRGFFRWTPTQQTVFQRTLQEVMAESTGPRDTPALLTVIRQLASLPAVEVGPLARLAADPRPAVQEGALRALGRLDAGQGVPVLLEAMGDARARVAMYALRSAVLAMPADAAVALLRAVKLDKVTVAKECVRLLGEVPSDAAFRELQRLDGETLHRDVRVALLRALWAWLERPEAWAILDRAVGSADPALLSGVVRIPADRLSDSARRRLLAVLLRLLEHPEPAIRQQVLQRFANLPIADPDNELLPALLRKLPSPLPDERRAVSLAVFAVCRPRDAVLVGEVVAGLLPQRRPLSAAVQSLRSAVGQDRRRLGPVARAVLTALAPDPLTAGLRAALATEALSWRELAELFARMASGAELDADVLTACAAGLGGWAARTDGSDLAHLEEKLARNGDDRLRRLALAALTVQAIMPEGWSDARLGRLRQYRTDPSPLVAAAAQFTLPADEENREGVAV